MGWLGDRAICGRAAEGATKSVMLKRTSVGSFGSELLVDIIKVRERGDACCRLIDGCVDKTMAG